jgi:hypothetical protein
MTFKRGGFYFKINLNCFGSRGMEYIHAGIKKGNMIYAYHAGIIYKDKTFTVKNGSGKVIIEGKITKDINYIFYTSLALDKN